MSMHPALHRLRDWYHQHLGSSTKQGLIQAALLTATAVVLVVPMRPGSKPVINLFGYQSQQPQAVAQPGKQAPQVRPMPAPTQARANVPPAVIADTIKRQLDFANERASSDAHTLAQWVVDTADNGPLNFAILDKKNAKVFVFAPSGKLIGASPVLLGYAAGDDSVAGIGKRPIAEVQPFERTTPAGRFRAEPGRNAMPEDVLWVDYEAAVSMHRVRLTNPSERRAERLKSHNVKDRRISYGCINMPPQFFEKVLWPNFRSQGGYVYVLPEVKRLDQVFPKLAPKLPLKDQMM
jgi:hypothetical protein